MPEGDTIAYAAHRMRPVLEGAVPQAITTPQARHRMDRWPQRLAGRAVRSVDAYGKHLFLRFEGDLVIHSHLRMTGSWRVRDSVSNSSTGPSNSTTSCEGVRRTSQARPRERPQRRPCS